jgi:hypothetical protein
MNSILLFGATLLLLLFTHRWATHLVIMALLRVTGHLNVAMTLYALLILPGTIVHEVAHWLMALLLGVRAGLPRVLPSGVDANGRMVLGYVQIERTDPLRHSLIGVAPLLAGSGLVAWIASRVFTLPVPALTQTGITGIETLFAALPSIFQVPDVWLYLYLLFAIANGMLPSPRDREAWLPVVLFAAGVAIVVFLFVGVPQFPDTVVTFLLATLGWLTFTFIITALLNAAALVVLLPINWLLRGGR